MATKRYRLTNAAHTAHGAPATFSFRIGYEKVEGAGRRYVGQKNAPIVTIVLGEVVRTDNEHAQLCLEQFRVHDRTLRNGVRRATPGTPTLVFEEVSGSAVPSDTNLDAVFV